MAGKYISAFYVDPRGEVMKKRILSVLMALVMVLGAVFVTNADTLSDLQAEQERLEQEAAEYEAIIKDKEGEISEQEAVVEAIAQKVANVNSQIAVSREKIAVFDYEIAQQEAERDTLNAKVEEMIALLRQRIRALYIAGDTSALEIVLGAKDFGDYVDKMQLVEYMADYDEKLINDINSQLEGIEIVVADLEADKADLEAEKAVLEEKQSELDSLLLENKEALASLYGEKEELESLIHSNESSQSEIDQKIEAYYEELRKQEEQQQQQQGSQGGNNYTPEYTGNYVWPAPGFYTKTSEYYEERTGYYHGGIDIAGPGFMGATIVAAASGTVIDSCNTCSHNWGKYGSCGCGGGFGNYVWIDHGGGKATIYAHLSYHTVSTGAYVEAGQVIGYAGSTGYSTGPHLHFECRYYGAKYDPMTELS